jgi:hypothetical protein
MAEPAIAANVHQTLDVHRGLATKITLDRKERNLIANLFQIAISEVFDFLRVIDPASFANFASARPTNTKNGGKANLCVLLWRNVNASYTCHVRPLNLNQSALTLFVTRVSTDHSHNTFAADDLAVAANFLYRSRNSHFILLKP